MRGTALLARAFIVIFALTAGLAGAAAAAQITDSAGGAFLDTKVTVGSVTAEDRDRDGGKDRDKDRKGKQVERSNQSATDAEDAADEDTADEDTADTETVDTDTDEDEDTGDEDTDDDDTGDDDPADTDDTDDED